MTYQIEGKSKQQSLSVTMFKRTAYSSLLQCYFCCFSRITKPHNYSESASLSFIEIFLNFFHQCSVRKPNSISASRDPNSILIKIQSSDTTEIIPVWSFHESWFWPLRMEIICEIRGGLACRRKAGSSLKLFFFPDVPMYLYVNTLKIYQQFSTYSLIIDGNGIKQSILIFWK